MAEREDTAATLGSPPALFDTDTQHGPRRPTNSWESGKCKGCGQTIQWAVNCNADGSPKRWPDSRKVKKVPLNLGWDPAGTWTPCGDGRARTITKGELVLPQDRFMGHHATCPDASRFKTTKKGGSR